MRTAIRLIRLHALARLRSAGPAPWLLLAGWLLMARFQEPQLLRRFGVHLIDDAAWSGCFALLVVLVLSERRLPLRWSWASNLALLLGVAVAKTIASALIDQGYPAVPWPERLMDGLAFFVAWSPLALVLAAGSPQGSTPRALSLFVVLAALVAGSMLATAMRATSQPVVWMAAGLCLLASASWASRRAGRPKSL